MTDKLPPQLLALFQSRPPLRFLPPTDYAPESRTTGHVDGLAAFLPALKEEPVPYQPTESWVQKRDRERLEKVEATKKLIAEDVDDYKPREDPNIEGDPFKTLFIARLDYKITEAQLRSTFQQYGRIKRIRIPVNELASSEEKKKRPHVGYAFIEFSQESEMKNAYKDTNHMMLGNRRIVTDVERGRTTEGWRPVRFGGGLGGRGYTKEPAGRPMPTFGQGPPPGGSRGGFGFRGRGGGFGGRPGGFNDRGGYGGGGGRYGGGGGRAPEGAPSGPRGPRSGGYSGGGGGGGGYGSSNGYSGGAGGGGRFDDRERDRDRDRHRGHGSGGNREPLGGGGGGGGGYRDRDRENDRKRPFEGSGGYDESRQRRRY